MQMDRRLAGDLRGSSRSLTFVRQRRSGMLQREAIRASGYRHERDDRGTRRVTPAAAGDALTLRGTSLHFLPMIAPPNDLRTAIAQAVSAYEASRQHGRAHGAPAHDCATAPRPTRSSSAVEPWREMPEVAGPIYERVVAEQPTNARALVILANAYWLSGRGPEVVGALADRAIAADPKNRGAWHMWALTEGNQRDRTIRWLQVTERFPEDQLAKAALADNASSLASAEQDKEAMALAIQTYEAAARPRHERPAEAGARDRARHPSQVDAVSPDHDSHAPAPAAAPATAAHDAARRRWPSSARSASA